MTNKFFFFFFFFSSNVRSFLRSSRSLDIIAIAIFDRPDQISHQVHWHCWLSVRKSIWSVKIEWWGVGVVICHERRADCLHIVQLMPLHSKTPLSLLALFKSRLVVSFWYRQPTYRGCPGKEAVRRVQCSSSSSPLGRLHIRCALLRSAGKPFIVFLQYSWEGWELVGSMWQR